jgi:hypothetical protein
MSCDYYSNCHHGFWYWFEGDKVFTIFADLIIILVVLVILWGIWSVIDHFRTPFCATCGETRTRATDENGRPFCHDCRLKQRAASEKKVKCPIHGVVMTKRIIDDVIIDSCPNGCVFLDSGELDTIRDKIESQQNNAFTGAFVGGMIGGSIAGSIAASSSAGS